MELVFKMLSNHGISYLSLKEYVFELYTDDDTGDIPEITEEMNAQHEIEWSSDYIQEIANDKLLPLLVVEVFNILFYDRKAMMHLNVRVAEYIGERTKDVHIGPNPLCQDCCRLN